MNRHFLTSHPCLTLAVDGTLPLLQMQRTVPRLEIWEQQEKQQNNGITSEWLCTQKIELKQPDNKEIQGRDLRVLREKCGTLLISDIREYVYTANLKTGTMEEVVDWPGRGPYFPVPLDIDWPSILSYQVCLYLF